MKTLLKWLLIAGLVGLIVGAVGSAFAHVLAIVFLDRFCKNTGDRGTNTVTSSVHSSTDIPLKMAPLIFAECLTAPLLGMPVQLAAACGMVGVFCGVTNCPITSLLISFELFGFAGMPYYLVTVAVSYLLSCKFGLYQRILYSKTETRYINSHAHCLLDFLTIPDSCDKFMKSLPLGGERNEKG